MRIALVTGSSRGIGRATALRLAETHTGVVVHYRRDESAAEEVATALRQRGTDVLLSKAELEDPDSLDRMMATVRDSFGRLDTLVANAAAGKVAPLLAQSDNNIQRTCNTTITSFLHIARLAVPLMSEGSRIVAVSGIDARMAVPFQGMIGAVKAALEALVRQLAFELAPLGIGVNAVVPGVIATAASKAFQDSKLPAIEEAVEKAMPIGRYGTPEEVAAVIAFLCSDDASYVTGQSVLVDGGVSAGGGPFGALTLATALAAVE